MRRTNCLLAILWIIAVIAQAQFDDKKVSGTPIHVTQSQPSRLVLTPHRTSATNQVVPAGYQWQPKSLSGTTLSILTEGPVIKERSNWGTPSWIVGEIEGLRARSNDPEDAAYKYLEHVKSAFSIEDLSQSLIRYQTSIDENNAIAHVRYHQVHDEVVVFGGEVIVHVKHDQPNSLTGRYYSIAESWPATTIAEAEVCDIIKQSFGENWRTDTDLPISSEFKQMNIELMWYPEEKDKVFIPAYIAEVYPDFMHKYFMVIDARDGSIIKSYQALCQLFYSNDEGHEHEGDHSCKPHEDVDGPMRTLGGQSDLANGIDLLGVNRTFQVTNVTGTYYMIDISRPMYKSALSELPNNPVGAIRTLDGLSSRVGGQISYTHLTSNNNSWNDPAAVSAHYNAGRAYEYYLNTFGRNSINGSGSTITSLIHITDEDGGGLDNAFWNGEAMFYGNGRNAFFPLAAGLDVAGHEISHGVVQATANLVYENESGALNESFADVFGAMIDRDDWLLGEDVVQTNYFTSGAMRNMQDPTQGFSSLNDPGYQPAHYSQRYLGDQDNGGVHINSGITNRAFYLFATAVGKEKAEQVYYAALSNYLTRTSNFKDCRASVLQAALDLYGSAEHDAAASAFDAVGILGDGNETPPSDDSELAANPGKDHLLFIDDNSGYPYIIDLNSVFTHNPLAEIKPMSKPSITDNGREIVFVGVDKHIYYFRINWPSGIIEESLRLSNNPEWRNVEISKDGLNIAATTSSPENSIYVFNLNTGNGIAYPLYIPTTAGGVTAGEVLYSDAMEFDYSGEYLLYDAVNRIEGTVSDIEYWDIGVLRVWDNDTEGFGDGNILKIFSNLPAGVSIGNPTLSHTRPNVITFDYLEESLFGSNYRVYASNIENGNTSIIFNNSVISYPEYSKNDDRIIFNALSSQNGGSVVGQVPVQSDRITPDGNASVLIAEAKWAVWFGTGDRNLQVATEDLLSKSEIMVSPNPARDLLQVEWSSQINVYEISIYDLSGRMMTNKMIQPGSNHSEINVSDLSEGYYILRLNMDDGQIARPILIQTP